MLDPLFDSADYELRWPRDVFTRELTSLRTEFDPDKRASRIEFLLEEAFLGETPVAHYRAAGDHPVLAADPWATDPADDHALEPDYLDRLSANIPQLRSYQEPRPYWPDRQGREHGRLNQPAVRRRFAQVITELRRTGHFGRELPEDCVDDRDPVDSSAVLAERLGVPDLWPLQPDRWGEDTFYGLIEVFHDLAVRPRERSYHSFDGCGWHYSAFSTDTGRALFRWQINRLLEHAGVGLRLAESGADVGRLVQLTDQARSDLIDRALASPDPPIAEQVQHAISLFRRREATTHDKRSAVVALANILEDRRSLLKSSLFSDDETALFHIANKFDFRHRNDKQHTDYDPAFRDWVFWWYLSTIELTDRLLDRQSTESTT